MALTNKLMALTNRSRGPQFESIQHVEDLQRHHHLHSFHMAVLLVLVIDGLALALYSSEISHFFQMMLTTTCSANWQAWLVISMGIGSIIADRRDDFFAGTLGLVSFMVSCSEVMCVLFWSSIWLTLLAAFF